MQYVSSEASVGVQVADIIGNVVYRSLKGATVAKKEGWLSALKQKGQFQMRDAVLPALRPTWQVPKSEKAAL